MWNTNKNVFIDLEVGGSVEAASPTWPVISMINENQLVLLLSASTLGKTMDEQDIKYLILRESLHFQDK